MKSFHQLPEILPLCLKFPVRRVNRQQILYFSQQTGQNLLLRLLAASSQPLHVAFYAVLSAVIAFLSELSSVVLRELGLLIDCDSSYLLAAVFRIYARFSPV